MDREDIINLAHKINVLDEQHYGSIWADRLAQFAHTLILAERERCMAEISALKAELDYYRSSFIMLDKGIFDGSQK